MELEIPPDYYRTVGSFFVTSSGSYETETDRSNALLPILTEFLGQVVGSGKTQGGFSSDGVCTTKVELDGFGMLALLLLWELKNEIGTGGRLE